MNDRIELASGLELIVIGGGSLKFNEEDKPLRDLVRRTFEEVQIPVLQQFSESIDDKALRPVDSIGWTRERGMLTDRADPQPGYNHIILVETDDSGNRRPIGMRVSDEFTIPHFGRVLMDYFSGMVPKEHAGNLHYVDSDQLGNRLSGKTAMTPHGILSAFTKHLLRQPSTYEIRVSDGVGIEKERLAAQRFLRYGSEGQTMLWVPPLSAETHDEYQVAIPTELYIQFGSQQADRRLPLEAGLFLAVNKYIKEGGAELNASRLRRAGYDFNTLPSVVNTRKAHAEVAAANGGFIPTSPIRA